MRKINGTINSESTEPEWIQLNPYITLGTEPKPFTPKDLIKDENLIDNDGNYVKITDFGGGCFFGKDSYSYMMIQMKRLIVKEENPNRFYFSINTHNPECVDYRTPENPEGSKYGGVSFGSWANTIQECIDSFPNQYRTKRCGSLYYHKTLKITNIEVLDLETGIKMIIEPTEENNKQLNTLKYKRNPNPKRKKSLEQQLKEAVKKENYKLAIKLRDEINKKM